MLIMAGLVATGAVLFTKIASAEEVVYQKNQVVDFGDDTIEGDLSKPDGQYLESQKKLRHQRLIKIRDNFKPEILHSVQDL